MQFKLLDEIKGINLIEFAKQMEQIMELAQLAHDKTIRHH